MLKTGKPEDFQIYVIYKDGKPYLQGIKGAYVNVASAKAMITKQATKDAEDKAYYQLDTSFYDMAIAERRKLVNEEKKRWEIKIYKEMCTYKEK